MSQLLASVNFYAWLESFMVQYGNDLILNFILDFWWLYPQVMYMKNHPCNKHFCHSLTNQQLILGICFINYAYYLWILLLQTVFITSSGAWKLGGFGFAIPADQTSSDPTNVQPFHYAVSLFFNIHRQGPFLDMDNSYSSMQFSCLLLSFLCSLDIKSLLS